MVQVDYAGPMPLVLFRTDLNCSCTLSALECVLFVNRSCNGKFVSSCLQLKPVHFDIFIPLYRKPLTVYVLNIFHISLFV